MHPAAISKTSCDAKASEGNNSCTNKYNVYIFTIVPDYCGLERCCLWSHRQNKREKFQQCQEYVMELSGTSNSCHLWPTNTQVYKEVSNFRCSMFLGFEHEGIARFHAQYKLFWKILDREDMMSNILLWKTRSLSQSSPKTTTRLFLVYKRLNSTLRMNGWF